MDNMKPDNPMHDSYIPQTVDIVNRIVNHPEIYVKGVWDKYIVPSESIFAKKNASQYAACKEYLFNACLMHLNNMPTYAQEATTKEMYVLTALKQMTPDMYTRIQRIMDRIEDDYKHEKVIEDNLKSAIRDIFNRNINVDGDVITTELFKLAKRINDIAAERVNSPKTCCVYNRIFEVHVTMSLLKMILDKQDGNISTRELEFLLSNMNVASMQYVLNFLKTNQVNEKPKTTAPKPQRNDKHVFLVMEICKDVTFHASKLTGPNKWNRELLIAEANLAYLRDRFDILVKNGKDTTNIRVMIRDEQALIGFWTILRETTPNTPTRDFQNRITNHLRLMSAETLAEVFTIINENI
jgi:hypothetical protein